MALDSGVLARSFQIAADEMTKLAPFIDDLDGVGGGDCDTGTNARVTFQTLAHGCAQLSGSDPLSVGLDCAIQSGIRGLVVHGQAGLRGIGLKQVTQQIHSIQGRGKPAWMRSSYV